MKRLILYGGAFDPIHNGHLRIASEASKRLDADVVFIPTSKPRWKEKSASNEDRLLMLTLALKEADNPRFSVSDIEMKRQDDIETYTSDTIKSYKEIYSDCELCLLIGGDQVAQFDKWHEPDYIKENAKIYFVSRDGYKDPKGNAERFEMTYLKDFDAGDVSSTSIRELNYIDTPIAVLEYIENHSLYFVKKLEKYLSYKRLRHSLSVARLSYEIALSNHIENPGRAYIAGALHDIGKEIPDEEAEKMVEGLNKYPNFAYHQFVGAYLAEKEFLIEDKEILEAIRQHCLGAPNMSVLSKIIYAADKIDPERGWNSKKYIELCKKDIEAGFLAVLKANYDFLEAKRSGGQNSVFVSKECFEYYLGGKNR